METLVGLPDFDVRGQLGAFLERRPEVSGLLSGGGRDRSGAFDRAVREAGLLSMAGVRVHLYGTSGRLVAGNGPKALPRSQVELLARRDGPVSWYVVVPHGLVHRILVPVQDKGRFVGLLGAERAVFGPGALAGGAGLQTAALIIRSDLARILDPDIPRADHGTYALVGDAGPLFARLPSTIALDREIPDLEIGDYPYALHSHLVFAGFDGRPVAGIVLLQDMTEIARLEQGILARSTLFFLGCVALLAIGLLVCNKRMSRSLSIETDGRLQAEATARAARREWAETVDAVPEIIMILDPSYRVVRANRRLLETLSLPEDRVYGLFCYDLLCGAGKVPSWCPARLAREGSELAVREVYYEKIDSCFDVSITIMRDEQERIKGMVLVARSIQLRKRMEHLARRNRFYLESVLEGSLNTVILATDESFLVVYANQEAARLLGIPWDQMVGCHLRKLLAPLGPEAGEMFDQVADGSRDFSTLTLSGLDRRIVLEGQFSVMKDPLKNFSGILFIARDVTAQRETEDKLRRAEKLEAMGLLAAGVAHELNNILSGLVVYPQLLRKQLAALDSRYRDMLARMESAGVRAANVVSDLLAMSRGIQLVRDRKVLNVLVEEYLSSPEYIELKNRFPGCAVKTELAPDCWPCLCSETHIVKVVTNLVGNAMEAMDGRGTVWIRTWNHTGPPPEDAERVRADRLVVLEVRDDGPGIAKDKLNHIFEPFFSTKKLGRSGSGLGLFVVWNTVQEHDGVVIVESDRRGTTFRIYLPAVTADHPDPERRPGEERSAPAESRTENGSVLVVDDMEDLRYLATSILSMSGYEVLAVPSGEEAVEKVRQEEFDLIVLDMDLGEGMNGRETGQMIRSIRPDQKIVVVSGLAGSADIEQMLGEGLCLFLPKPYTLDDLVEAVGKLMSVS
ncbi:ATP-binding protein [Desulfolithobacter sp.]